MPSIPPVLRGGTRDLPDVPPLVQYLIGCFLEPILAWFSTLVYGPLLLRCADHPLVLLAQWYDPSTVVAACASFHHPATAPGRPPTFTIDQFVRAEIVRAWADCCSDPALEELLSTNLLVRWFVGLPLTHAGPDHSTLAAFHAHLTAHAPDAFFQDVLRFLDRVDPEPHASTPQIVATFAMASPIARTTVARQQRLQSVLTVVDWVISGLTPHLGALDPALRSAVAEYLDALAKVQADELTTDESGYRTERTTSPHGVRRLASAVDRAATFRKHDGNPAVLGTNAVISTTATRIRACVALTGCTPDSAAPVAVLVQQQQAGLPLPPQLIMDQAAGWGKVRADVDIQSAHQTTMVARVPTSGGSDPNRFTVADFGVNVERTTCTCPNGVVSTKAYASGDGDGVHFRFLASQCRDCPLWATCRDPHANPKGHRSVFISDYHVYLRAADTFNHTPAGRALLASRWRVEPTVAWLVRYQGCRQARRVGHVAAQGQLYQACARCTVPCGATTAPDPRRCPSRRRAASSPNVRQRPRDRRSASTRPQLGEALLLAKRTGRSRS